MDLHSKNNTNDVVELDAENPLNEHRLKFDNIQKLYRAEMELDIQLINQTRDILWPDRGIAKYYKRSAEYLVFKITSRMSTLERGFFHPQQYNMKITRW